jgi:hypothetical protein
MNYSESHLHRYRSSAARRRDPDAAHARQRHGVPSVDTRGRAGHGSDYASCDSAEECPCGRGVLRPEVISELIEHGAKCGSSGCPSEEAQPQAPEPSRMLSLADFNVGHGDSSHSEFGPIICWGAEGDMVRSKRNKRSDDASGASLICGHRNTYSCAGVRHFQLLSLGSERNNESEQQWKSKITHATLLRRGGMTSASVHYRA